MIAIMEKNALTGKDLAIELGRDFLSMRRQYNRLLNDMGKDLPTLSENVPIAPEVEQFVREHIGSANEKKERIQKNTEGVSKKMTMDVDAIIAQKVAQVSTELMNAFDVEKAKIISNFEVQVQRLQDALTASENELAVLNAKKWYHINIQFILDLINYTEMAFASYGGWVMAKEAGLMVTVMTNAFYYVAVHTVKDGEKWNSSQWALVVTFFISILYAAIHYNTFTKLNLNTDYDQVFVSGLAAVVVTGIAWASLVFSKLKTQDSQ
jgi:hypothetical protein